MGWDGILFLNISRERLHEKYIYLWKGWETDRQTETMTRSLLAGLSYDFLTHAGIPANAATCANTLTESTNNSCEH